MKYLNKFTAILTILLASSTSFAADDDIGPLNEADVRQMLSLQGVDATASAAIISALKSGPEAKGESDLQLSTVLFTHGGNMSFFVDNDSWNFDAAIKYQGKVSKVRELYEVYYWNGGLTMEIVYKWMWVFIPKGTTLSSLDSAVYGGKVLGRGIAVSSTIFGKSPVGIEAGWVGRQGGMGNVFIVAAKVGVVAGNFNVVAKAKAGSSTGKLQLGWPAIMFPKLEFRQKKVL